MKQVYTILFDLDGTLVDTAPDLMRAHNHVMNKFGYPTKSTEEIRNLVGQGAGAMLGRSIWGQAKKEFGKVQDEKIKKEMVKEFVDYYGNNIVNESKLIDGVKDFLIWSKENKISMGVCTNKQEHLAIDLLKKIGIYDFFEYVAGHNNCKKALEESLKILIRIIEPMIPHLAEECWYLMNNKSNLFNEPWPDVNKDFLVKSVINMVIQINGKRRVFSTYGCFFN